MLQLTTTAFVDRTQQVHGGPIEPDKGSLSSSLSGGEEAAAQRWLQTQFQR